MNIAKLHLHWGGATQNGKKYKSYSLAKSVRKNGKNSHQIIVKLGKLQEDEIQWWRNLLKMLKKKDAIVTTLSDIISLNHYAYFDVAIVNHFWNYWSLDKAFRSTRHSDVSLQDIAKILTINRCTSPESKLGINKWFRKTALPQLINVDTEKVNKSRIFRELQHIEDNKELICEHLLNQYTEKIPDKLDKVFYDLSSTTFSGTKCIISKYGHCKEGYQTHVVLALLVTEDGLPFYWEVLPGGTADAKTIDWLLKKCKDKFKQLDITAVFDRGFVGDENLKKIEAEGIKYISAMDKNQIEKICGDFIEFSDFSDYNCENILEQITKNHGFTKANESNYYQEITSQNARRFILCFNPQLFHDQRKIREERIANFINEVLVELNTELQLAKKSRSYESSKIKFTKVMKKLFINSFIKLELEPFIIKSNGKKIKSFQAKVEIDESAKKHNQRLDGFWMLVTNLKEKGANGEFIISSEKALQPYRDKVIIEDAFRDIKSHLEIAPVYVWLENHVKAHYTICVLSYLINRTISNLLKQHQSDISSDIKTHINVYKEFQNSSIDEIHIKNLKQSNFCQTALTKKQKDILKRLGATSTAKLNGLLEKFNQTAKVAKIKP